MQPLGRFTSRFRRKQHDDSQTTGNDGPDPHHLALQVREQLDRVGEYRQEHEQLATVIRERLDQLDGMAQRVTLSGLLQEGINVLVLQHDLAQQLTLIESELGRIEIIERRLRTAEQQLLERADEDSIPSSIAIEAMPADPVHKENLNPDSHGPAQSKYPERPLQDIFQPLSGAVND